MLVFGERMVGEKGMAGSVWGGMVKRSLEFVDTEETTGGER